MRCVILSDGDGI